MCFGASLLVSSWVERPLEIAVMVMVGTVPLAVLGYWIQRSKQAEVEQFGPVES